MLRRMSRFAMSIWAFTALSSVAMAQTPGNVPEAESGYMVWVVLAGAGLIICATGFMNPKRSHLN